MAPPFYLLLAPFEHTFCYQSLLVSLSDLDLQDRVFFFFFSFNPTRGIHLKVSGNKFCFLCVAIYQSICCDDWWHTWPSQHFKIVLHFLRSIFGLDSAHFMRLEWVVGVGSWVWFYFIFKPLLIDVSRESIS